MSKKSLVGAAVITGLAVTGADALDRIEDVADPFAESDLIIVALPADTGDLLLDLDAAVHDDGADVGIEYAQTYYGGSPNDSVNGIKGAQRKGGNITLDNGIKKPNAITLDNGIKKGGKVKMPRRGGKKRRKNR
ncbi:MAG: hypothetical protein AAF439_04030 [Pseudomonadota bacterium]